MSNVVDFMEMLGSNAQLRHASPSELGLALADAHLDQPLQAAILAKDQQQLEQLMGVGNVCCMLFIDMPEHALLN